MIKSVFALVALLHFCYNADVDINLNMEIMGRLEQLKELQKQNNLNITYSGKLQVPVLRRDISESSCVGVFTSELNHLLNHVAVPEGYTNLLDELKANLQALEPHPQIDKRCQKEPVRKRMMVFHRYILFLKKLNNSKAR